MGGWGLFGMFNKPYSRMTDEEKEEYDNWQRTRELDQEGHTFYETYDDLFTQKRSKDPSDPD